MWRASRVRQGTAAGARPRLPSPAHVRRGRPAPRLPRPVLSAPLGPTAAATRRRLSRALRLVTGVPPAAPRPTRRPALWGATARRRARRRTARASVPGIAPAPRGRTALRGLPSAAVLRARLGTGAAVDRMTSRHVPSACTVPPQGCPPALAAAHATRRRGVFAALPALRRRARSARPGIGAKAGRGTSRHARVLPEDTAWPAWSRPRVAPARRGTTARAAPRISSGTDLSARFHYAQCSP